MAIQHTVVFRLAHADDSPEEKKFLDDAQAVLTSIEVVKAFTVNRQISPKSEMRWQFSMVFANATDYETYNAHPAHTAFVSERWQPEVTSFQEYDFATR